MASRRRLRVTSFPHEDLGVDVYHPDFAELVENVERIVGVFITHGHEDHIGGLPYLLDRIDVPVYGPPHALGLARRRLSGASVSRSRARPARGARGFRQPRRTLRGRADSSVALDRGSAARSASRAAAGTVMHSGDFNLDPDPPDGEPTDVARLEALGDRGVQLLLCGQHERGHGRARRFGAQRGGRSAAGGAASHRVFIAMFASNIQRLRSVGEIAARTGRKTLLAWPQSEHSARGGDRDRTARWPSNLVDFRRTKPPTCLAISCSFSPVERRRSRTARCSSWLRGDAPGLGRRPGRHGRVCLRASSPATTARSST